MKRDRDPREVQLRGYKDQTEFKADVRQLSRKRTRWLAHSPLCTEYTIMPIKKPQ